jgi:glucose-6-phosphate dehydrogenase assembly protein OpcA
MSGSVWSERDTKPLAIEEALRGLLRAGHEDGSAHTPARVLNLIAVVDREWRGEVMNRLEQMGRYHASRTIVCSVGPDQRELDATVSISCPSDQPGGEGGTCKEWVEVAVGPSHLPYLDSVAGPILVSELPTVLWSPHGHPEAVSSLIKLADAILLDTVDTPSITAAVSRAKELAADAYVVDLAWLRGMAWRRRIAALFDPPEWRRMPWQISKLTIRHPPESGMVAMLLVGWLATMLEWKPRPLLFHEGTLYGKLRGKRQHIEVRLERSGQSGPPGVNAVMIETASESALSLERAPGGFAASRRAPGGEEWNWTILGAPPHEVQVLGEGVRQAIIRDPTYEEAVWFGRELLASWEAP